MIIARGFYKYHSTYAIGVTFSIRQALLLLNESTIESKRSSEISAANVVYPLKAILVCSFTSCQKGDSVFTIASHS